MPSPRVSVPAVGTHFLTFQSSEMSFAVRVLWDMPAVRLYACMSLHARTLICIHTHLPARTQTQGFRMVIDPGDPSWFECVVMDVCPKADQNPCPNTAECAVDQVCPSTACHVYMLFLWRVHVTHAHTFACIPVCMSIGQVSHVIRITYPFQTSIYSYIYAYAHTYYVHIHRMVRCSAPVIRTRVY
jgi:hypothetical protein